MRTWHARAFAIAALVWCTSGVAAAQDFYQGKTLRIIVGSSTGGGYDSYARLIARYVGPYIPGTPSSIVVNMPGGDGTIAANHLFNIADKDGATIGVLNRYVVLMKLLGSEQAKFNPAEFGWIGSTASYSASDNAYLFVVRSALPHRSIADLRNPNMALHVGTSGTDVPAILKEALGLSIKLVTGYRGSDDLELAFNRGELDAHTTAWSGIQSRHSEWLRTNFIRPLIQVGRTTRSPALPDVPTARELAKTSDDKALIEFLELPMEMARPFAAPPGVPKDRLEILKAAFAKTVADPQYQADGRKQKLELTPKTGAEITQLVQSLAKVSPAVIERYKKALEGKMPSGG